MHSFFETSTIISYFLRRFGKCKKIASFGDKIIRVSKGVNVI